MQNKSFHRIPAACVVLMSTCILFLPGQSCAQSPFGNFEEYDLLMDTRPDLRTDAVTQVRFKEGLIDLWTRALNRPDEQLQRLTIDTLAIAQRRGVPGVKSLQPRLVEMTQDAQLSPKLAVSITNALVAFEATDQAELLVELINAYGPAVAAIAEPALAAWSDTSMETQWRDRLENGSDSNARLIDAINGLAAIQSDSATELMKSYTADPKRPLSTRLIAARALGSLNASGLIPFVKQLRDPNPEDTTNTLLAVQTLSQHTDQEAVSELKRCLSLESTAVHAEVLEQLYRIDTSLVEKLAETYSDSTDANVRRWCLQSLAVSKRVEQIKPLCQFLGDINPNLRRQAASQLIDLAKIEELKPTIIAETVAVQQADQWQGCEQACYVLTQLDHTPSSDRMVELLGHQRGDVKVAAAWGLSKLRVADHLPDMLDHAQSIYDGFKNGQLKGTMRGITLHQALLFNAFGDQGYRAAEPLLEAYVPKNYEIGVKPRVAALWALGVLHKDDPNPRLVKNLVARLNDDGQFPEIEDVRNMAAVSLGRMRAETALEDIRKYASNGMPGCQWALEFLTGEKPPPLRPSINPVDDWFLSPAQSIHE